MINQLVENQITAMLPLNDDQRVPLLGKILGYAGEYYTNMLNVPCAKAKVVAQGLRLEHVHDSQTKILRTWDGTIAPEFHWNDWRTKTWSVALESVDMQYAIWVNNLAMFGYNNCWETFFAAREKQWGTHPIMRFLVDNKLDLTKDAIELLLENQEMPCLLNQ